MDRLQIAAVVLAAVLLGAALFYPSGGAAPRRSTAPAAAPMASADVPRGPRTRAAAARPTRVTPAEPRAPEKLVTLHNDAVEIRVSSVGLRIDGVELPEYKATTDAELRPGRAGHEPVPRRARSCSWVRSR